MRFSADTARVPLLDFTQHIVFMDKFARHFFVSLSSALLGLTSAHAVGTSQGLITKTYAINAANPDASVFIFKNASSIGGTPTCNSVNQEWAVRLSTPFGKSVQQQVQLAAALGKEVFVAGEGVCSLFADRETPSYIVVLY